MLFIEHLQILGLEMGCSWEEARESHRAQIKLWHPDRFAASDPRRTEAEQRSKALNRAITELRPFLTSSHYAKRQLGQRVRRSQRGYAATRAVYNDRSMSWASRSGSYPTLNRHVRRAIIPSHVTLITRPAPQPQINPTSSTNEKIEKQSWGSSGRWKSFVGDVQAKIRNVTRSA